MSQRKRRQFSNEFKAESVRLCKVGDRSIERVAIDLDLPESSLRRWIKQAEVEQGQGPVGALTSAERDELDERGDREIR